MFTGKNFILNLLFAWILTVTANAQVNDTVCMNQTKKYWVYGYSGSSYYWQVNGGTILGNSNNDTITVKWGFLSGNYTIKVVETSIYGCVGDTIFSQVSIIPKLQQSITGPTEVCEAEIFTLSATQSGTYKWNTGSANTSITQSIKNTTTYYLLTYNACPLDTVFHHVTVHPKPVANFSFLPLLPKLEENIYFTYTGTPATTFNWFVNNQFMSNTENPLFYLLEEGKNLINLQVKDGFGCADTVEKEIYINELINIWIPTAFTPDNNGLNDLYKISSINKLKDFSMRIFNCWGQIVFECHDINIGWDGKYMGKDCPTGCYIVVVNYTQNQIQHSFEVSKTLTLIR